MNLDIRLGDREVPLAAVRPQPSSITAYCLAIASALRVSGVDSERVLRAAGIPAELSTDPMSRMPTATITRLYRVCLEVTNNPYFGLIVARQMQFSTLHALGFALAASCTLMDFCKRLERFFPLISQVVTVSLSEADGKVYLRFDHFDGVSNESEDALLVFFVLSMRQLYKPDFNPVRLDFFRPIPREGAEPYQKLVHAPITFSNPYALLVFDRHDLLQPLPGASPELVQINDNIALGSLTRLDKSDVVTGVTKKIIELLPRGDCDRDKVASALGMSPSMLQLKLSQQGANFQQLLDDTRKELGCAYVQQPMRSITEITFLLGFANTSNFTRAFRRWTGLSPSDFRSQY